MASNGPYSVEAFGKSGYFVKGPFAREAIVSVVDYVMATEMALICNMAHAEGRKSVQIKTPCPSCGFTTLCVDDSGNLVCSFLECKNPTEIANKEGRKAAEKEFKELLELANEAGYFNQDIMSWRMKYADWKRARGIE